MTDTLIIERSTEEDLPEILNLYAQSIDDGVQLPLEKAKEIYARVQSYPNYEIFVARIESRIVGTFALLIMDNLGHLGSPSGIVEDVAVHPSNQGLGIGKAMMEFAKKRCQENGCYKFTLSSNLKREQAHSFYQALGFEQHGYSFMGDPNA